MTFEVSYSRIDRLVHDLAFWNLGLQKILASLEDDLFSRRFSQVVLKSPVFITALPRAGTTLLLEILAGHPSFAAHSYRDMPFVLSPLIWDRLSSRFRKSGPSRERAHGDGIAVGYDSPEAFEEVAWRAFWPSKYLEDRIEPWSGDEDLGEFREFFANHLRKIIALRGAGEDSGEAGGRYVSKNNANIARIPLLVRLFPDACIVVPVRHPLQHAASLFRQHGNFSKLQAANDFGRRYMEGIGHFEFGRALRPIDMGGWLARSGALTPESADFWIAYWIATYELLLRQRSEQLLFLDYDRACADPTRAMTALAERLGLADPAPLTSQAKRFRRPPLHQDALLPCDTERVRTAFRIHEELQEVSIP